MTTANESRASARTALKLPLTTMIGSLPHHNADAAVEVSFRTDLPFLPQIPVRNPAEYMIAQALEGLPGLVAGRDGVASLHVDLWTAGAHALKAKLERAFAQSEKPEAFDEFLPSGQGSACLRPFLWELGERKAPFAKAQLSGPITAQSAIRIEAPTPSASLLELTSQIFRLVLARSIAMIRALRATGANVVFFVDEPGLSAVPLRDPRGLIALQELRILIQTLKKEGAWIGLHCCGDADWGPLLDTAEPDFLSIDCGRSLASLLSEREAVKGFIERGGRFAFGLVSTQPEAFHAAAFRASDEATLLQGSFEQALGLSRTEAAKVLNSALYTPACGLAFHSPADVEQILGALKAVRSALP